MKTNQIRTLAVFGGLLVTGQMGCNKSSPTPTLTSQPVTPAASQATSASPTPTAPTVTEPTGDTNAGCTKLAGNPGESSQWGSGWIDLNVLANFEPGTKLKINVGGSASKILVRLLKDGQTPEQPNGVLGQYDVPSSRLVEVPITARKSSITQISVHGSPRPWTYSLGAGNGPATIEEVEYCK